MSSFNLAFDQHFFYLVVLVMLSDFFNLLVKIFSYIFAAFFVFTSLVFIKILIFYSFAYLKRHFLN